MIQLDDEQRALLDGYARATRPRPTEVDHALTRTLARIESATERRARRLPRRRRGRVLIMAASLVLLIGAGAAMAAVHWLELRSAPEPAAAPAPGNAARHDHDVAPNVDRAAAPTQPSTIAPAPEPTPALELDQAASSTPPPSQPDANTKPPTPRRRARAEPNKVEPQGEAMPAHQLADENHLLTKLRRALDAGQYASALDWADEHARRHPKGALTEERLLLEAVAACRAGQTARGRAAIGQLRDRFPGSPAIARVERACASEPADANP